MTLDLSEGAQIQLNQNIFLMNFNLLVVVPGVSDVNCVGNVFDASVDHGVVVYGAAASYAHGGRNFVDCQFRRSSSVGNDMKSDLLVDGDDRILVVAPDFQRAFGSGKKPKYNIETAATYSYAVSDS